MNWRNYLGAREEVQEIQELSPYPSGQVLKITEVLVDADSIKMEFDEREAIMIVDGGVEYSEAQKSTFLEGLNEFLVRYYPQVKQQYNMIIEVRYD